MNSFVAAACFETVSLNMSLYTMSVSCVSSRDNFSLVKHCSGVTKMLHSSSVLVVIEKKKNSQT